MKNRNSNLYLFLIVLSISAFGFSGCCPCNNQKVESNSAVVSTQHNTSSQTVPGPNAMFDYRQIKLDNGLDVITLEDFSTPIVAVQVWYHVGSKDENPQRQGFAHMFEHMMFRGTDRLGPTDHFGFIRKVGGYTNGYTSFDKTVYLETLPAEQLDLALWLEAERMAFLDINQENFDTERKVVEEERRMNMNQPYGTLYENLFSTIYFAHPYRWTPIGKIPHLRASSVQELRDFWTKYYVPSNATLVIAGAVTHEEAQKAAKKYFGWIPKYPEPQRVDIREPEQRKQRQVTLKEDNAPAPGVGVVYRTVPLADKDAVVFDIIAQILGSGNSSRLYRQLVADKQLAVAAEAASYNLEQDGLFGAGALLPPVGSDPNQVLGLVVQQVERFRNEPVSEKELTKARNQLLRGVVTDNLKVQSKARLLGSAAVEMGDVSRVNSYIDDIKAVTADDILRVAKEYFEPQRAVEIKVERNLLGAMFSKADEDESSITAKPEIQAPPPGRVGEVRPSGYPESAPFAKPHIENVMPAYSETVLDNGMKVLVVTNKEVPFVIVDLGFLGGAWSEHKPGMCSMAMQMLTKGTENYTEGQLADELETYAIGLNGSGSMDTSMVTMTTLTANIDRGMKLMGEVVRRPIFPSDELEKLRRQVITGLEVSSAAPEYIAEKEFRKELYGKHPYSRTAVGEISDVNAIAVDDIKSWWAKNVRPDSSVLIFAGDIDNDEAVAFAKKTFGDWRVAGTEPQPILPQLSQPKQMHIYLVDRPGSIQSQIRAGQLGITRQDDDYFVSRVVSNYFGWSFNSRLNESIRVQKGLTYAVWGGYEANRFAGAFKIGTFSKTESTAEAVRAIIEEVQRLKAVPPSDKELDESKSYILGGFVRDRETPGQVADDLWLIESQNLGSDYLQRLLDGIADAEREDCVGLTNEKLTADKLIIIVVGQADKLQKQLEEIAPVTLVQP
ncbi:MAG: pitrilysin family protein [Phycisphaerae bacterium]|jgi:zinc protease